MRNGNQLTRTKTLSGTMLAPYGTLCITKKRDNQLLLLFQSTDDLAGQLCVSAIFSQNDCLDQFNLALPHYSLSLAPPANNDFRL